MEDYQLYNTVYKHLLYSIQFGFYPSGYSLPSSPELCATFGVSRSTVHRALKLLEDEQYVSLSQGRSAIVTYSAQTEACRAQYNAYRQSTKDALLDLNGILWMIWPDILVQGLRLCGERDLEELSGIVAGMAQQAEYPYLGFFCGILRRLENPLVLKLYLSTVLFGHCTAVHLGDETYRKGYMAYLREAASQMLALRRAGRYTELKELLTRTYHMRAEAMQLYYNVLPVCGASDVRTPYRWNYYTERPSVGFDLAMKLLREIYAAYRPMQYLPSVAALSRQYGIPVITVRRAIQILNDIGVTDSVNGKGTRVIVGSGITVPVTRLSTPNMKKVLLPYLQSVQVVLLICKDVALAVFPTLPDSAVQAAMTRLREILASGDHDQAFGAAFKLILGNSPSPALREILGGLMYYQYFGYPLRDMEPNDFRYDPRSTQALLEGLEKRDGALFAEALQRLTVDIFKAGKKKLLSGGVMEAEPIALPQLEQRGRKSGT